MELTISNVSKRYHQDQWGVRDVSMHIAPGVMGLLGPNGAGKSTLMRILATIMQPTDGSVRFNGTDIAKSPNMLRKVLGYLPQDFGVYPNLNAVEFLSCMAAMKGLHGRAARRRIDDLIAMVNLTDSAYRPIGRYSGGMLRRVGIAQALLNDPQLLITDEPTVGLDPEERTRFRNLIADLAGDRIIILSTHIVSDVASAASTIALMIQGRLLCHMTAEEMITQAVGKVWTWLVPGANLQSVRQGHLVTGIERKAEGALVRIVADTPPDDAAQAAEAALDDAYHYLMVSRASDGA